MSVAEFWNLLHCSWLYLQPDKAIFFLSLTFEHALKTKRLLKRKHLEKNPHPNVYLADTCHYKMHRNKLIKLSVILRFHSMPMFFNLQHMSTELFVFYITLKWKSRPSDVEVYFVRLGSACCVPITLEILTCIKEVFRLYNRIKN